MIRQGVTCSVYVCVGGGGVYVCLCVKRRIWSGSD